MDFRKKPARDPTEVDLAAKTAETAEMQCFVLRASCFVLRLTKHQALSTVFVSPSTKHGFRFPSTVFSFNQALSTKHQARFSFNQARFSFHQARFYLH